MLSLLESKLRSHAQLGFHVFLFFVKEIQPVCSCCRRRRHRRRFYFPAEAKVNNTFARVNSLLKLQCSSESEVTGYLVLRTRPKLIGIFN